MKNDIAFHFTSVNATKMICWNILCSVTAVNTTQWAWGVKLSAAFTVDQDVLIWWMWQEAYASWGRFYTNKAGHKQGCISQCPQHWFV